MTQVAVWIEDRPGKQAVAKLEGDHLAAVEMPGQDQIIAAPPRRLPDAWVVGTQNPTIARWQRRRLRTRDGNGSLPMHNVGAAPMNPLPATTKDRIAHPVHAHSSVVVAAHRKDGRGLSKRADQLAQLSKLRRLVHQVAPKEHDIDRYRAHAFGHLPAKTFRSPRSQMNVAHIHEPARILAVRKPLLADVKSAVQSQGEPTRRQVATPVRYGLVWPMSGVAV